jgi:hypothetical protein
MGQPNDFARRFNDNGTIDSICRRCFATVMTATWESELDNAERRHICDPEELERFRSPHRMPERV